MKTAGCLTILTLKDVKIAVGITTLLLSVKTLVKDHNHVLIVQS